MKQCKLNLFPECPGYCPNGADFAKDKTYRYHLWRKWGDGEDIAFIGLNPSTANEKTNDPTIRRLINFAKLWGYTGIDMYNLFALVSAYPQALITNPNPIQEPESTRNDNELRDQCFYLHKTIVLCWGSWNIPIVTERIKEVTDELKSDRWKDIRVMCFGINKDGNPKHPLYLKSDTKLIPYSKQDAAK